jgi:hypothetical protein
VFKWRRLIEEGTMSVLGADEPVVPESDVKVLKGRIRELERPSSTLSLSAYRVRTGDIQIGEDYD